MVYADTKMHGLDSLKTILSYLSFFDFLTQRTQIGGAATVKKMVA
jgi:hypothetical protein